MWSETELKLINDHEFADILLTFVSPTLNFPLLY